MLSRGRNPDKVGRILRLGSVTALGKDGGGVRGTVAGKLIRRLTARTITSWTLRAPTPPIDGISVKALAHDPWKAHAALEA